MKGRLLKYAILLVAFLFPLVAAKTIADAMETNQATKAPEKEMKKESEG